MRKKAGRRKTRDKKTRADALNRGRLGESDPRCARSKEGTN